MTRLCNVLASVPWLRRLAQRILTAAPVAPLTALADLLVVRSCGRLIETLNLTLSRDIDRAYVVRSTEYFGVSEDVRASFCTTADLAAGEEIRIYCDGYCCFSGHVQSTTMHTPLFGGTRYFSVQAEQGCTTAPAGWRCTRRRHHTGPCAAVPA